MEGRAQDPRHTGADDEAPLGAEETAPVEGRRKARRHGPAEQERLLAELDASGEDPAAFCTRHAIQPASLGRWRTWARQRAAGGEGGKRPERVKPKRVGPATRYSPEQRREAVEAFQKSGRTRDDFARLWGCSSSSLAKWLRAYRDGGPQALEDQRRPRTAPRAPHPSRLPESVRDVVAQTKADNPHFGLRRVRDFLRRFRGLEVSAGTVRNVLAERGVPPGPTPRKRRPARRKLPRRFERARPRELWQSDITSYVLRRHGRRVYLTVYLDDHSRFIVAWRLASRQTADLVIEPLLEGVARFGKPVDVLTDQGRQYFAWRGKSAFQKLLAKEGIGHVVSRAHHPQTLGKCERLWKTVGDEFWDRAKPQDLAEAQARLAHFFAHYNHFRPHQGIDGAVPADRFFGADRVLRETLEKQLCANELRLALDEAPRRPVYLVGQVDGQAVSLHGESGRLVVSTPEGGRSELAMADLGVPRADEEAAGINEDEGGKSDGRARDEHADLEGSPGAEGSGGRGDRRRDPERSPASACAPQTHGPQADPLPAAEASGDASAGAVDSGDCTGAARSARAVHGDAGILDGQEVQGRSRARAGGEAAAGVAAQPAGPVGDAGGTAAPAAGAAARATAGAHGAAGGRPAGAQAADRAAGGESVSDRGPGPRAENRAVGIARSRAPRGDGRPAKEEKGGRCRSSSEEEGRAQAEGRSSSGSGSDESTPERGAIARYVKRWLGPRA